MNSWRKAKLGDLTTVISSGATPLGGAENYSEDGPVLFIRSQNVLMNALDLSTAVYITDEFDRQLTRTRVETSDVLLNITGASIGRVATFVLQGRRANVNQHVCVIRPKSDLLFSGFLSRYLATPRFQAYIDRIQAGGTRQALNFSQIAAFDILLPPMREQRRIAAILDMADALCQKRRVALQTLDSLTQSIFLDMFGDPRLNSPGHFQTTLESVCELITDGEHLTPKRTANGIKLLSARNIQDGFLDFSDVDHIDEHEYKRITSRCKPQRNDILLSCSGTIGRVSAIRIDEPLALVRSAALLRPIQSRVRTDYLEAWLQLPWMTAMMKQRANASSQANLFQNQIKALPVLIPEIANQDKFVVKRKQVSAIRDRYSGSASDLQTLFRSLQQGAFKGDL